MPLPHQPPPAPEAVAALVRGYATHLGIDPTVLNSPGTSVIAVPNRAGTRRCSAYEIGPSTTLWCDPDIVSIVESALPAVRPGEKLDLDAIDASLTDRATHEGRGLVHLTPATGFPTPAPPQGVRLVLIDLDHPADMALLEGFTKAMPDDDLEMAEIDLSSPDPHIVLAVDHTDAAVAYASWLPWDTVPACVDVGVATLPSARRIGAGRAVVVRASADAVAAGHHPVYRCDVDNIGSARLAVGAGYVAIHELSAWKFQSGLPS